MQLDTVFVTQDGFKDNGLFFAFTAFWINTDSFRVQIWRPAQGSGGLGSDPVQQLNFVGDVEIASERVNATYTVGNSFFFVFSVFLFVSFQYFFLVNIVIIVFILSHDIEVLLYYLCWDITE